MRPVLRAVGIVLAVFLSLGVVCRLFLRVPLPQYEGSLECPGLLSEVRVVRDSWGIPHIEANNEHDLYFAQGYVVAQDRLWQMDLFRRLARGRLSEVIGKKTGRIDSLFLTLQLSDVAEREWQGLDEQSRAILTAYADGVNACIRDRGQRLSLEFALLGYKPAPWKPQDCLVISRLLAWMLSMGWMIDPVYIELVDSLGFARVAEIEPEAGIFSQTPAYARVAAGIQWSQWSKLALLNPAGSWGSNNWAIAGSRTAYGKPILANDPHLLFVSPGFWYLIALDCGDIHAVGGNIPGVPGIIAGRNRWLAWGMTNGMVDDVDFFLERLSEDSTRCLGPSGWEPVKVVWDTLYVKGEEPQPFRILVTPRGPIVSHLLGEKKKAIAIAWTGYECSDEIRAFHRLLRARAASEGIEALSDYLAPAQNFVFADVHGNIAYKLAGRLPRRQWPGLLLRRAWREEDQWFGDVPYEDMPEVHDPADGFVASANFVPPGAKGYVSCYWEPASRIERIRELLDAESHWTPERVRQMQLDTLSRYAVDFVRLGTRWIPTDSLDRQERDFLTLLQQWDGRMGRESVQAAVYAAFLLKTVERVFRDEMGDTLFAHFSLLPSLPMRVLLRLLEDGRSSWFDDVRTSARETVRQTMLRAFRDALEFLRSELGDDIGRWRWGNLHKLSFRHPLGSNWMAAHIFNVGGEPHPGGIGTINNAAFGLKGDFSAIVGPSLRMVADLSVNDPYLEIIQVPGQCEIPRSPFFANLVRLWRKGELIALRTSTEQGEESRILTLVP